MMTDAFLLKRSVYLLDKLLQPTVERVKNGAPPPLKAAWDRFREEAQLALDSDTVSVIQQTGPIPDKLEPDLMNLRHMCWEHKPLPEPSAHDFRSYATYRFPNPNTEDGLPWMNQPRRNEEAEHDQVLLDRMINTVNTLAEAYLFTGEERFAADAVRRLQVWFLDAETHMTPHLTYAQHIPGETGFKEGWQPRCVGWKDGQRYHVAYGGVIAGHRLAVLVENFRLLATSEAWTNEVEHGLKQWFFDYQRWLMESKLGLDESVAVNNHASWFCNQMAAYAELSRDDSTLAETLDRLFPVRVYLQIEPDGSQPYELGRHTSWIYVNMSTCSFINTALIGDRHGRDLWNFKTEDGRSLRAALDWIAERIRGEAPIEGENVGGVDFTAAVPLLAMAAVHYKEPAFADLLEALPGYPEDSRYRLLYPTEEVRRLAQA